MEQEEAQAGTQERAHGAGQEWEGKDGPDRDPELASPGYTIEEAMDAIGEGLPSALPPPPPLFFLSSELCALSRQVVLYCVKVEPYLKRLRFRGAPFAHF